MPWTAISTALPRMVNLSTTTMRVRTATAEPHIIIMMAMMRTWRQRASKASLTTTMTTRTPPIPPRTRTTSTRRPRMLRTRSLWVNRRTTSTRTIYTTLGRVTTATCPWGWAWRSRLAGSTSGLRTTKTSCHWISRAMPRRPRTPRRTAQAMNRTERTQHQRTMRRTWIGLGQRNQRRANLKGKTRRSGRHGCRKSLGRRMRRMGA
mmetsp:Transcript_18493/g.51090  ORF Transcript_18493/g.51090 Transcript_18493/m.51090 type:complete len:206 (-) Transcript_18493:559-1176(-)